MFFSFKAIKHSWVLNHDLSWARLSVKKHWPGTAKMQACYPLQLAGCLLIRESQLILVHQPFKWAEVLGTADLK